MSGVPPERVKGHENCCSVWTVNWAAQPRLTDKVWFDAPLVADSDGAAPVEAAAPVEGTEGADGAWPAAGLEGGYPIDDSGDFAGLLPGPGVTLCRGAFDAIAVGIDAVTGVTTASADDMIAAARWCWALTPRCARSWRADRPGQLEAWACHTKHVPFGKIKIFTPNGAWFVLTGLPGGGRRGRR